MAQVTLWSNARHISIPVTLGNGNSIMMEVMPSEAFFDDDGYVRIFSMQFDNDVIGNFKLLPTPHSPNQFPIS